VITAVSDPSGYFLIPPCLSFKTRAPYCHSGDVRFQLLGQTQPNNCHGRHLRPGLSRQRVRSSLGGHVAPSLFRAVGSRCLRPGAAKSSPGAPQGAGFRSSPEPHVSGEREFKMFLPTSLESRFWEAVKIQTI